jgi:hypothetical protein
MGKPLRNGKIMSFTTFSGPVRSLAGFVEPVTYIFATDVVGGEVNIPATGNIVILSPADGGPATEATLVLPQVVSGAFNLTQQPADARYDGAKGDVLNYGAVAHKLKGYGAQTISGVAEVTIAAGTVVQWAGNGNQAAPWTAISTAVLAA